MNQIGAKVQLDTSETVPRGGEVQALIETRQTDDLAATILELRRAQQTRRYCIKSQSMLDRRLEALIVEGWGYHTEQTEAERKKLFERAAAVRIAIERGKDVPDYSDNMLADDLPLLVRTSMLARSAFDEMRDRTEVQMEKLAKTLPVWPWVESVRGLSAKGLAVIVGEAPGREWGGLRDFATKERLWKRLGLAVINGQRQGNPGRLANAADWTEHGYKKTRRSELWVIGSVLFRAQWRGEKDGVPAHPIGPYGEKYAQRRRHTEPRIAETAHLPPKHPDKWTPGRCHNDAVRIMTKQLVADLWRAWRRSKATVITTAPMTPADPIGAIEHSPPIVVVPRGRRAKTLLNTKPGVPSAQPTEARPP